MLLLALLACVAAEGEWWALTWEGALIGREQRSGTETTLGIEREWRFYLDDSLINEHTQVSAERAPDGRVIRYSRGILPCYTGSPVWLLEEAPLGEAVPVLHPERCAEAPAKIGDHSWEMGALRGELERDEGGRVRSWTLEGMRAERVEEAPAWPAHPPTISFGRPQHAVPRARTARLARFRTGSAVVPETSLQTPVLGVFEVRAPLRAEWPAGPLRTALDAEVARLAAIPQRAGLMDREDLRGGADCADRARALVKFLEDRGEPARMQCGLLYVERAGGARLVPHAWVWVDSLGGSVDPSTGEVPASAARLELGCETAALATQAEITLVEAR